MHQSEEVATDATRVGDDNTEHRVRSDGTIDGVPSTLDHIERCRAGEEMGRHRDRG
jgi:hypothetical protein